MLTPILESADARANQATEHLSDFKRSAADRDPVRSLKDALGESGLSIIAEIKRRSPSAGAIDAGLDPVGLATEYEAGGAAAISVLTEPDFFGGSLDDLVAVRSAVGVPVLRKDFTRNEAQVWEAYAAGADAALLIVATLTQPVLERLIAVATDIGIDTIVEVHTSGELARAVDARATIIGVNNRDLGTFRTDLRVGEAIALDLPDDIVSIGESGVSDAEGAARMRAAGYDAILVGEALVRSADPAGLVAALRGLQ